VCPHKQVQHWAVCASRASANPKEGAVKHRHFGLHESQEGWLPVSVILPSRGHWPHLETMLFVTAGRVCTAAI